MEETVIWKDVKGYEGLYKVNNMGDVLSIARRGNWRGTHLLTPSNDGRGYRQVNICKNGKLKSIKVHKLVAEAFVPNPHGYKEINHIDENKWNCEAKNLEWCTRNYNVHYGTRTKKTSKKIAMYSADGVFVRTYDSIREAGRLNHFKTCGAISNVLKGKAKTAYGYKWKEVF